MATCTAPIRVFASTSVPLVAAAYLVLVAGLLAAFGGRLGPALLVASLAAAAAALRRDARLGGLALTLACGALAGALAVRTDAACRARAGAAGSHLVALAEDAAPGRLAHGTLRDDGCALPASLTVDTGPAARAGDVVHVAALARPAGRGVALRDATVWGVVDRDRMLAWRAGVARTIDVRFGRDAPLARALLVGDERALSPEIRDRFADAGLVHVLSISGLHVTLVAAALELLLRAVRAPARVASAAAVVAVAAYVALIGAPPPAVRAAAMLAVDAGCRVMQRPTSPWAALSLGGLAPLLVDPSAATSLGYQLSMAGMAALVAGRTLARRLADRARADRRALVPTAGVGAIIARGGWRAHLARELATGLVATVVTAPLVAWHFGRVSLAGPLANLAAAPVVSLLQPTLFLALLVEPVHPLAALVAAAAHPLLAALDAVARVAAAMPGAAMPVAPSLAEAALGGVVAASVVVACVARAPGRALVVGAGAAAVVACAPLVPRAGGGVTELHVIDVGQGDAIAIRTARGRWLLVDAGRTWRGGDAGRRTIIPYLRRRGGPLVAFVLSHPHADHVGGAAAVLRALHPQHYWDAAFALGSDVYRGSLDAARTSGVRWHRVRPGDSLVVDGVVARVLAPDSAWTASLDDPNLASTVLSVRVGRVRFLLTGDAEAPEERWLLDRARDDPELAAALRADVLKVAHHGSATSTTPAFVDAVRPRLALVSVGADNMYGHPSAAVVRRLQAAGAEVVRTDRVGAIVVRTDGRTIDVDAGGETWTVQERASAQIGAGMQRGADGGVRRDARSP